MTIKYMKDFTAGQVISDLRHIPPLNAASDLESFVVEGPGFKHGLGYLYHRNRDYRFSTREFEDAALNFYEVIKPTLLEIGIPRKFIYAQITSPLCCEGDKYIRLILGEGKPKQRYGPKAARAPKSREASTENTDESPPLDNAEPEPADDCPDESALEPDSEPADDDAYADAGADHHPNGGGWYPHGEQLNGHFLAEYIYRDAAGANYQKVVRTATKQFPQWTWTGSGWQLGAPKIKLPYRLPELIAAPADDWVFVCEGEKDADTVAAAGLAATTNPGGAGKWRAELNGWFAGKAKVALLEDNDEAGRAHVRKAGELLRATIPDLRIVRFSDLPEHGDVTDWLRRHSAAELVARAEAAAPLVGTASGLKILSKAEFIRDFVPPDYLIDGILQRRFIYSLTGQTGHAKTAIALRIAQLVDCGGFLDGHEVTRGRVAYLVGENPDDVRMRVIGDDAVCGGSGPGNILFVPGCFDTDALLQRVEALGPLDLIIIDTSAAYFLGDDENSNAELGEHARKLRRLIGLPGGPCGLVLCHPIKHAAEPAQLLPRGGGSFLAEMDGNLTAWKDDRLITLHHSDKFRGAGFEPISFRLDKVLVDALKDSRGRMIPTVRAVVINEDEEELEAQASRIDEDQVLLARLEGGKVVDHGASAGAELVLWRRPAL
jgi:hypothetical protein